MSRFHNHRGLIYDFKIWGCDNNPRIEKGTQAALTIQYETKRGNKRNYAQIESLRHPYTMISQKAQIPYMSHNAITINEFKLSKAMELIPFQSSL